MIAVMNSSIRPSLSTKEASKLNTLLKQSVICSWLLIYIIITGKMVFCRICILVLVVGLSKEQSNKCSKAISKYLPSSQIYCFSLKTLHIILQASIFLECGYWSLQMSMKWASANRQSETYIFLTFSALNMSLIWEGAQC